jgi:response regulator RpfG family c-di-GMP phosphodiesterase
MSQLVPHLLLRSDRAVSHAAEMLRSAGYMVSEIDDDAIAEMLAGESHVDAVVVELPVLRAIALARRIEARYGGDVVLLIITSPVETVRRALASVPVLSPAAIADDLVSAVDLAFVARQLRHTG